MMKKLTYSTHNEKNLLLLKDLLEIWTIKSTNKWLQCQKMCGLVN